MRISTEEDHQPTSLRTQRERLERYCEAFEDGQLSAALCDERIRGHRERLEALREQDTALAAPLATQAHTPPNTSALARLADQPDQLTANAQPDQPKESLRSLAPATRLPH